MDIRQRHVGPIVRSTGNDPAMRLEVDVGALIRRIVLFEHCTLESAMLKEVPSLIRVFGPKGLELLLQSGCLSIVCDAITMGEIGQFVDMNGVSGRPGGPLPLGSYRIASISFGDREQYIHEALQNVHEAPGMGLKEQIKLKKRLVPLLERYPSDIGSDTLTSFLKVVERSDWTVRKGLEASFHDAKGMPLPKEVDIHTEILSSEGDFRVSTNLSDRVGLGAEEENKIIERGMLGVAGLEQRLQIMRSFSSLSGFRSNEISIFEERLSWLGEQLDPAAQENRFERVVQIAGLPGLDDLPEGLKVDAQRLLRLRESNECREFRQWLREIDTDTDREIEERFASMRERLSEITHTKTAKTTRFIVETGVGVIPGAGIFVSPALTLLDNFLIEKLIGQPGPVTFLSRSYPSIFQGVDVPLSELLGGEETH